MPKPICSLLQLHDKEGNIIIQSSDWDQCIQSFGTEFKTGLNVMLPGDHFGTIEQITYEILPETITPAPIPNNWLGNLVPYSAIIRVQVRQITGN